MMLVTEIWPRIFLNVIICLCCAAAASRLRRQLPINISSKQALNLWNKFIRRNIALSIELQQQPKTNVTIFSAYAGTYETMALLFAIQSSLLTNQITVKFRDDKEQIKNYILSGSLGGSAFHTLIFALNGEVFQLVVDCAQLIKATDPHLSFRYPEQQKLDVITDSVKHELKLKPNQTKLKVYLGNDIQENHKFFGITRQFSLENNNPIDKICGKKLQINLSNPIRITTEKNVVKTATTEKSQPTIELIARHGLELEKTINDRLNRLEDKLNKLGTNLNTIEARISFLEHLQRKRSVDDQPGSNVSNLCNAPTIDAIIDLDKICSI